MQYLHMKSCYYLTIFPSMQCGGYSVVEKLWSFSIAFMFLLHSILRFKDTTPIRVDLDVKCCGKLFISSLELELTS